MSVIPLVPVEQLERERRRNHSTCPELWVLLDTVSDPEIPALSIWDMGILQDVQLSEGKVVVNVTPTYSGCPAMDVIREDVHAALLQAGYPNVDVVTQLSPAWTTDWMTAAAQKRLRKFGIAAPDDVVSGGKSSDGCQICNVNDLQVRCPQCESVNTKVVSEFGSTACKALLQCSDCGEPFDYFKRI